MASDLRLVDWRFLLPGPCLGRVACSAPPKVLAALRAVAGDVIALEEGAADCDVVVLIDPRPAAIAAAHAAVRPGGALYIEGSLERRTGGRRALTQAGFTEVRAYWRWPPRAPRVWVSVDASGPLEHALSRRARGAVTGRTLRTAAVGLWHLARAGGSLLPTCVTAHAPAAAGRALAWEPWLPQLDPPIAMSLHAPGDSELNKVVVLLFPAGARRPGAVVKRARVEESRHGLAREAANLAALRARAPALPGVPRLRFERPEDGAVGETVLAGRPLYERMSATRFPAIASQVTDWLIGLAAHTRGDSGAAQVLITSVRAEFRQRFSGSLTAAQLRLEERALAALPPLPSVFEHRDCSPWNLLLDDDGRELAVLDWESSEPAGVPLTDLTYFLANAGFVLNRGPRAADLATGYRMMLSPASRLGAVVQRCEQRYALAVGIPPPAVGPLRALTWMIHACSLAQRSERTGIAAVRGWSTLDAHLGLWAEAVAAIDLPGGR